MNNQKLPPGIRLKKIKTNEKPITISLMKELTGKPVYEDVLSEVEFEDVTFTMRDSRTGKVVQWTETREVNDV